MARWTDLAPRQEHTANQGGPMSEHRGVVLHIAEGSYEGTISWQKNPTSDVSSHFIVDTDGDICQMVDTATTAWTQKAGNGHWLSIENAGHTPSPLTAAQVEAAAQILARAHKDYGVPLQVTNDPDGKGLGHHSMGAHPGYPDDWGHSACPGSAIINQKPAIVTRAKQIIEGDDMDARETAEAVLETDGIVENKYFPWRADSPAHEPPGSNEFITLKTAVIEAAGRANLAVEQGKRIEAKVDQILAAIGGTPLPPAGTTANFTGTATWGA